ncbi:MAG: 4Fe-4S binding protein [Chitinispirillaceae bacterium]|nr:4Fe-4S binding protein [Chitinispirillaceae bacterium]
MKNMRKIRIFSQIFFFLLFVGSFYFLNNQNRGYNFESEFFLRFNPFSAILTFLASHSIIFSFLISALIITIFTILFGRFFCGFVCPLGTLIDFVDMVFKKMRLKEVKIPLYFQRSKYIFAIILLTLAVFGSISALYEGPLSFTTRFLTLLIDPALRVVGVDIYRLIGFFSQNTSAALYSKYPLNIRFYYSIGGTLLLSLIIFGSTLFDKRFWCQYVCPTGAFLGLLSRFSFFRRAVNENKCNTCQRCVRSCPVHAIDSKDVNKTNLSECIECGICVQLKEGCSEFKLMKPSLIKTTGADLARRHVLTSIGGGLIIAPLFRANAISKRDDTGRLIRPPGAIPEKDFLAKCIGCGECIKACPTNTLQPCVFSDGFNRIYTPKVVPRIAGCEEKCHLCGYVCPTGAIRKLPYEEKRFAKIGTAVIDRHRCLAWAQNKECLVCDEVCPYNAISAYIVDTTKGKFKVPVVDEDLCLGCGMCEQHCPIFDTAAIVVYKFGENRIAKGTYASDAQKKIILEKRKTSDSKHLGESQHPSSTNNNGGFTSEGFTEEPADKAPSSLPPGFVE